MTNRPNVLILNNRDSFVYNIARYVEELGATSNVQPSHTTTLDQIRAIDPDAIIISPGPCTPTEAGISLDCVKAFAGKIPILGVCLGHQVIGEAFGWHIERSRSPYYGEAQPVDHNRSGLFKNLPNPLTVGLYHSLVAHPVSGTPLKITARSATGEVMALAHDDLPLFGVQFHPESLLTDHGHDLLSNFLSYVPARVAS